MVVDDTSNRAVRRRPVLMAVAGALGGLGLAMLLIHYARIALGTNAPLVVIACGAVFGIALAYTLPPREPRGGNRAGRRDGSTT